ncbi:MAG TPA: ABC transporter substrate-binding protein [Spirochaetota bacterium]|nr:ABC transporter substrate-binding protein [Spirochaetota bacterium]HOM38577.1 ABC transporter substrate-binding protein [Spirochaetota bacterium]HPQ49714.1 ABC transporter substrate-binding protein [Spirochaetota bacterium]
MKKFLCYVFFVVLLFVIISCKEKNTIKVGILRPSNIYAGEMIEKGALMAVEEINSTGGINGKMIEVLLIDDFNKPDMGRVNLEKAIKDDDIDYIIGGMKSEVVLECMDVMAKYKKIWLGTGGATPLVIKKIKDNYDAYKYYFRVGTIDSTYQGKEGANFVINFLAKEYNIKNIAYIGADHVYSKFMIDTTEKELSGSGFKTVYKNFIPVETTDFQMVIQDIINSKPDVVFQAWPSVEALAFTKAYNKNKVPAILIGPVIESLKDEYFEETGGACVYEVTFSPQSGPGPITRKTLIFSKNFKSKYGKSAGYIAYPAYDAVYILKTALEKAKDYMDVVKVLETIDYEGNIWYSFTENHDLVMGKHNNKFYGTFVWFQWMEDGTRKAVYPLEFKQADFVTPPWIRKDILKK